MSHRSFGARLALRWKAVLSGVLGLSLVGAIGGSAVADENTPNVPRFTKIDRSLFESIGTQPGFMPASLSSRPVAVVLELPGAPVAQQDADAKARGQALSDSDKDNIRHQLEDQQNSLHDALANAGAQVVGQMQDAYNGIHVIVPQGNLAQLAALPGVTAIHAVASFTPDNTHGVPFIGGTQAWGTGFTGKGVKVASIDTGIDYTHADFGGPGTVAAWNNAFAHSTEAADPSMFGPNAPKVKGGFDFVGDAYNAQVPGSVPKPDPNPLDCFGHGTHTAATLAGFGVTSAGTTYHGPYNSSTVTYGDPAGNWTVGPGVAPEADLYVYRVFGCAGSSNVVDLAINRAVRDHVDVISMSLGSPLGGTDDPTSVAAQRAFDDGITVVASAGNNGGGAYVVGSPSTDSGVLSVAAIDAVDKFPAAVLSLTKGTSTSSVTTIDANGAPLPTTSLPVKELRNPDGSLSLGCDPAQYVAQNVQGALVITKRGVCARVARAVYGQKAGAAAVVMINNSPGFPPFEGDITSNPDTGEKFTVTIPFLGAQPSDTATLVAASGGTVSLSPAQMNNPTFKKAASFTSGGPRNPDSASKPDVMAPGVSVASAGMGTGFKAAVMSGTSMACPMTAGIAALVKQAHPSWKGEQIKAAIMNTANPSLNLGYNVRIAGTGVVQAQNAVNSTVLASTGDSLDSIAFGSVARSGDYTAQKTFTLTNYGTKAATYGLNVAFNGSPFGAGVSVSPSTVTVPASDSSGDEQEEGGAGKANVTVTLTMSKAAFAALPSDDTFTGVGPGGVLTVRGDVVATPTDSVSDHQKLRVPFMFVPRGLSNVDTGKTSKFTPGTGKTINATLPLANSGIHSGTADLYAWGIHKKSDQDGSPIDIRDVGIEVLQANSPNPMVPQMGISGTDVGMAFLINTYGRATNQSVSEFDVDIAMNGHTKPDFVVVGVDLGAVLAAGQVDGIFAAFVFDTKGNLIDANFAEAPMNGSIVELPFLASDIGLSATSHAAFTYSVAAFSGVPGGPPDFTGASTFDPFNPAVSSGNYTKLAAVATGSFTLTATDIDNVLGWLVAAVDNNSGEVQVREVRAPQGQGAQGQQGQQGG